MGSKGSQTTTTNQNQSYMADPRTQQAAGQALQGAESAAAQPFQMPVAPVAGFNPQQQQAFNQYSQIQGMAQPYYNQAAQYTAQSAAPITGADVNQYYNPMADNVTKQLQNIYGQQNVQNQGNLTAQAGGVGADRIAVGMGNLANQQGLASGQIYSQLYQQALQAAQQQKQMAAGAGSAFAGYGTGAQTAALQGTGALGQSGQIQQQQQQAELNAPYQNELARIAYQFQTPQYLAGIAGGLAPALGGTTIGNQQTTAPSPSWISQLLGLGTAGVGLAGSAGAFGGGSGGVGSYGQMANASGLGAGTGGMSFPMFGSRGGAAYAEGGEVGLDAAYPYSVEDYNRLSPLWYPRTPNAEARRSASPSDLATASQIKYDRRGLSPGQMPSVAGAGNQNTDAPIPTVPLYAEGGETDDQGPAIPGVHLPKAGGVTPIPAVSLPMGGGHSGPLTGGLNFPSPQQASGSGDHTVSDIAKIAQMAMMFINRGGAVKGYADGGGDDSNPDAPFASDLWTRAASHFGKSAPATFYNPSGEGTGPAPTFNDRFKGSPYAPNAPDTEFDNPNRVAPGTTPLPKAYPGPGALGADTSGAMRLDASAKPDLTRVPVTGGEEEEAIPARAIKAAVAPPVISNYMLPQAQQPYPDSLKRDWGQNAVRSPWLALVKAGATMAASPGPIGSVIGKGILAGTAGLEGQRKELRTEQELNDKAQQLYQNAQFHLDKYNRMTMTEEGNLAARNREIDQSGSLTGGDAKTQRSIAIRATQIYNAMERTNRDQFDPRLRKTNEQMQAEAYQIARRMHGLDVEAPAAPVATTPTGPGSSKDNPLPFPGKDVKPGPEMIGKYFIGPDGKVMIWGG